MWYRCVRYTDGIDMVRDFGKSETLRVYMKHTKIKDNMLIAKYKMEKSPLFITGLYTT